MTKRLLLALVAVFGVSQAAFHLLGLRFETYPLQWFLHFLDPELLRTRLLESVFYLHIQPPLFNLFAGLILKLTPSGTWLFYWAFLCIGCVFYIALVWLQLRMGVSRGVAVVIGTLFMLSPSFLLYDRWLFYTFPCAALVTLSALLLHESLRRPSPLRFLAFFVAVMLLCGMCSLFHLVYFVLAAAVPLVAAPGHRKTVLLAALAPFILVTSVYVKNWVEFDTFTASSIMGRNLWIMTVGNMNGQERVRLVRDGALSEVSLINRFDALEKYPQSYRNVSGFESIPALRAEKKTNGAENFNHLAHVAISRSYLHDALYGLRHYPLAFARTSLSAWYTYFTSSELDSPVNTKPLSWLSALYATAVYGQVPFNLASNASSVKSTGKAPCIFLFVGLPLLLVYAARGAARGKTGARILTREQRAVLAFCVLTILFVAVIGASFDVNETNRYRFMTDALSATCLGLFIESTVTPWLKKRVLRQTQGAGRE